MPDVGSSRILLLDYKYVIVYKEHRLGTDVRLGVNPYSPGARSGLAAGLFARFFSGRAHLLITARE